MSKSIVYGLAAIGIAFGIAFGVNVLPDKLFGVSLDGIGLSKAHAAYNGASSITGGGVTSRVSWTDYGSYKKMWSVRTSWTNSSIVSIYSAVWTGGKYISISGGNGWTRSLTGSVCYDPCWIGQSGYANVNNWPDWRINAGKYI